MILLGSKPLEIGDFEEIVFNGKAVNIDQDALRRCKVNCDFLQKFSDNKIIYGINTGFGPMAQYRINDDEREEVQLNKR